jgi:hypothetical protein
MIEQLKNAISDLEMKLGLLEKIDKTSPGISSDKKAYYSDLERKLNQLIDSYKSCIKEMHLILEQ